MLLVLAEEVRLPNRDVKTLSRDELEQQLLRLRAKNRADNMDKARQNAVFDSALDFAIVVTDQDGIITGWNIGAEQIMGWTLDEMRGQNASRIFTPEDRARRPGRI